MTTFAAVPPRETLWFRLRGQLRNLAPLVTLVALIALFSATIGLALSGVNSCACRAASPASSTSRRVRTVTPVSSPSRSESFGANTPSTSTSRRAPWTA